MASPYGPLSFSKTEYEFKLYFLLVKGLGGGDRSRLHIVKCASLPQCGRDASCLLPRG